MHVYPTHFHSSWSQEKRDAKEQLETTKKGFPGGSVVKNLPAKAGRGLDPWVG